MNNTDAIRDTANNLEREAVVLYGTDSQRERFSAGVLPEDELLGIVRPLLFHPFYEMPRWSTSRERDRMLYALRKKHEPCENIAFVVDLETTAVAELDAAEWERLKAVNAAAKLASKHPWLAADAVSVQTASHWVTCPTCRSEIVRSSAKVTIQWAGRALVREYAL